MKEPDKYQRYGTYSIVVRIMNMSTILHTETHIYIYIDNKINIMIPLVTRSIYPMSYDCPTNQPFGKKNNMQTAL